MNTPWVESPFFRDILKSKNLSEEQVKMAIAYHEDGFVVLPGLIDDATVEAIKDDIDNKGFNPEFKENLVRDELRVQDLWRYSDSIKNVSCNDTILDLLEMLYGRQAVPFQTLNFKKGSQQRAHSDTIHFSSLPARYMCGVWVALEDMTLENGPVFYYPKSHKLPEYDFSHIINEPKDTTYSDYPQYEDFIEQIVQSNELERKPFLAKKGDVLVWSSNILHGGSEVIDPNSTRYSLVTHYYFEDCLYYTPMLSNMVTRELYLRTNLENIRTGKKVKQSFNGYELNQFQVRSGNFILNNKMKDAPELLKKVARRILFKN